MSTAVIGLLGVILGSVLTGLKDVIAHFFAKKRDGRYAAVRLIAVLDEYAQKCVSVVGDDGTAEGRPAGRTEHGEEYLVAQIDTPPPPTYPDDIDWRSISFGMMYRTLALPSTASETDRYISASSDHAHPPDFDEFFVARQEGYAHLGLEALSLIKDLRSEFDLPEPSAKFWDWGWDAEKYLRGELQKFKERRELNRLPEVIDSASAP